MPFRPILFNHSTGEFSVLSITFPRARNAYFSTTIGKQEAGSSMTFDQKMKTILSTNEIIGFVAHSESELEICATAEANFDEGKSQMEVELDSFVRPVDGHSG